MLPGIVTNILHLFNLDAISPTRLGNLILKITPKPALLNGRADEDVMELTRLLWVHGQSVPEIARLLRSNKATITSRLNSAGLDVRRPQDRKLLAIEAAQLYVKGRKLSSMEIATLQGRDVARVVEDLQAQQVHVPRSSVGNKRKGGNI